MWTYATCCMSNSEDQYPVELHIFSAQQDTGIAELLFATAYYHKTAAKLGLNHTVNFGRSWQHTSICDHGLISLPYLDGPDLETSFIKDIEVKFYWLIPITPAEVEYMKNNGVDALEEQFDKTSFNYLDTTRQNVF